METANHTPAGAYLFRRNPLLCEFAAAAPVSILAVSGKSALLVMFSFGITAALGTLLSALIPQKVPYAVRILLYSVIAAVVYIPAAMSAEFLFPEAETGVYLPMLSAALVMSGVQKSILQTGSVVRIAGRLFCMVAGVCAVVLGTGLVRELLSCGTLFGRVCMRRALVPAMREPAMGMVFLALLCIAAAALPRLREEDARAVCG